MVAFDHINIIWCAAVLFFNYQHTVFRDVDFTGFVIWFNCATIDAVDSINSLVFFLFLVPEFAIKINRQTNMNNLNTTNFRSISSFATAPQKFTSKFSSWFMDFVHLIWFHLLCAIIKIRYLCFFFPSFFNIIFAALHTLSLSCDFYVNSFRCRFVS